jgi:hypothetical protein
MFYHVLSSDDMGLINCFIVVMVENNLHSCSKDQNETEQEG